MSNSGIYRNKPTCTMGVVFQMYVCIHMYMYVLCLYLYVFAGIRMYYNNMSEKMAKYENTYLCVFVCITMYCHVFDLY